MLRLSDAERELAGKCADRMIASAKRHRYEDRFGEDSRRSHYIGALGEILFARFLGVRWECHPADIGGRPDLEGYEVRTISPDARELYVKTKENDRPSTRIVAVALCAGRDSSNKLEREAAGIVLGWITAAQLREHGRWRDPGGRGAGAYFLTDLRKLRTDGWRPE